MQAKKKRRNSGARTVLYTLAIGIWYYRWYILAVLLRQKVRQTKK